MRSKLLMLASAITLASGNSRAEALSPLTGTIEMLTATDISQGKEVPTKYIAVRLESRSGNLPIGTDLQLVIEATNDYAKAKRLVGNRVTVMCSEIFEAETAHHFTDHLCAVRSISDGLATGHANATPGITSKAHEVIAQGIDMVKGAVVCSSYSTAQMIFQETESARRFKAGVSLEMQRQFLLINGYDKGREPDMSIFGCVLVPAGTSMVIDDGNIVPVVSGRLPNGMPFAGVTLPAMIAR